MIFKRDFTVRQLAHSPARKTGWAKLLLGILEIPCSHEHQAIIVTFTW
jgi:hypothetical protein